MHPRGGSFLPDWSGDRIHEGFCTRLPYLEGGSIGAFLGSTAACIRVPTLVPLTLAALFDPPSLVASIPMPKLAAACNRLQGSVMPKAAQNRLPPPGASALRALRAGALHDHHDRLAHRGGQSRPGADHQL